MQFPDGGGLNGAAENLAPGLGEENFDILLLVPYLTLFNKIRSCADKICVIAIFFYTYVCNDAH